MEAHMLLLLEVELLVKVCYLEHIGRLISVGVPREDMEVFDDWLCVPFQGSLDSYHSACSVAPPQLYQQRAVWEPLGAVGEDEGVVEVGAAEEVEIASLRSLSLPLP
jgi:hypothetical protein